MAHYWLTRISLRILGWGNPVPPLVFEASWSWAWSKMTYRYHLSIVGFRTSVDDSVRTDVKR